MRYTIDIDEMIQRAKLAAARDSLGLHIVLAGDTVTVDEALIERVECATSLEKEQQS
jgi:hypothetical protein